MNYVAWVNFVHILWAQRPMESEFTMSMRQTSKPVGLTCEKFLPCVQPTVRQTLWDCVCGHLPLWSLPVSSTSSSPPLAHCASVDVASVSWLLHPSCPQRGQSTVLNWFLNGTLLEETVERVNCNNCKQSMEKGCTSTVNNKSALGLCSRHRKQCLKLPGRHHIIHESTLIKMLAITISYF